MYLKKLLLLLLLVWIPANDAVQDKDCRISIDVLKGDLSEPQPLVLTDTNNPSFLLPKQFRLLVIPSNTSILLACPGKNNSFEGPGSQKFLKPVCLTGKQFLINSKIYDFSVFKCKRLPEEIVRKVNPPCLKVHQKYEIGFELENHFLKTIELCRDEKTYRTYYSKHTIVKEALSYQEEFKRSSWKYESFYPGDEINYRYTMKAQFKSLEVLLGSREKAQMYMYKKGNDWQWFHRGHLTPRGDCIYGAEQSTTFWLLNANPQWGSFNVGNWVELERSARNFTASRQLDLVVYTGVHGITTLKDVNDNEQPVYLHVNETTKMYPVPRFFWKILHDPISNRATAFIGLNEPHAKYVTEDMYLCPDISKNQDFSWLTWQPNDIKGGVSYVCTVGSLRKAVSTIPEIGETSLLI